MFHGTCPKCGKSALYGNILSARIYRNIDDDDDSDDTTIHEAAFFVCPNGHTFPMLEVIDGNVKNNTD